MIRWDSSHGAELKGWHDAAEKGHEWAVDKLLSRPSLPSEAVPFWSVFLVLSRDRPQQSISMGMGGGLMIPRPVPMETIRREGQRLGYTGEGLEDFVTIIARIDDLYVEVEVRRAADEARTAAARARK